MSFMLENDEVLDLMTKERFGPLLKGWREKEKHVSFACNCTRLLEEMVVTNNGLTTFFLSELDSTENRSHKMVG